MGKCAYIWGNLKEMEDLKKIRSIIGGVGVKGVEKLRKALRVGSKAQVVCYEKGYKMEFMEEVGVITLGIGKDGIGYVVMDRESLAGLRRGDKVEITVLRRGEI